MVTGKILKNLGEFFADVTAHYGKDLVARKCGCETLYQLDRAIETFNRSKAQFTIEKDSGGCLYKKAKPISTATRQATNAISKRLAALGHEIRNIEEFHFVFGEDNKRIFHRTCGTFTTK